MKVDPKKELDSYRVTRGAWRDLVVPPMRYLMVDGQGDPNTAAYAEALSVLYPVAYATKFASKQQLGRDYVVPPLEALWWADDMAAFTTRRDKSAWHWTAMILVPDWVPAELVDAARDTAAAKVPAALLERLRGVVGVELEEAELDRLQEGRCLQRLHVGSYDDEGPLLAELHDVEVPARGLSLTGRHHEIYLSDARRVAPAKLRTILRQPVR